MTPIRFAVLFFFFLLGTVVCSGQRLFAVSGGTGTTADENSKKHLQLVAENKEVRLVFGLSNQFRPRKVLWVIWVKIENLSDKALEIDPSKFNAVDDTGKAYSGLAPDVAIARFNDSYALFNNVLGNVVGGPLMGPGMVNASQRQGSQKLLSQSIQAGSIPERSFKEGMIYFESSDKKPQKVKVTLTGLWEEAITFSPNEDDRLRVSK